jgi:hypothetical protein
LFPAVTAVPTPATDRVVDVGYVRQLLDLDRRLAQVPAHAQVRGFVFKMTADEVARHGKAAVSVYRSLARTKSPWFFKMASVRDYLEDAAAGAAAINPLDPKSAIRQMWRNTPRYAPLFNAQRFLSLLSATPFDVMRWLEAQRDMFMSYGAWRVERVEEHYFVMHYFDENIWIDSAHRGGVEGVLQSCKATGTVDVDLDSPFNGRIHVRWQPG